MNTPSIYRVRFTQNQRYAINISAPSAELAEFFAEEIRKRAGVASFEAIGDPFSDDWQSEEICSANASDLLAAVAHVRRARHHHAAAPPQERLGQTPLFVPAARLAGRAGRRGRC